MSMLQTLVICDLYHFHVYLNNLLLFLILIGHLLNHLRLSFEILQHLHQIFFRKTIESLIVFGHWSALNYYHDQNIVCLDGGCVWGGDLIAINIMHPEIAIKA